MFAVIRTGGKQYRVAPDDVLQVARVAGDVGSIVEFGDVLAVGGEPPVIGNPSVAGASVAAEVLRHARGPKVIAFKKRRRKNSRRKRGYRDEFTMIRITEILTDGAKPTKTAAARKPKAQAKPAEAEGEDAAPAPEKKAAAKKPKAAASKPAAKKPTAKKPAARKPAAKKK